MSTQLDIITQIGNDLSIKAPCAAISVSNISLNGLLTIDGYTTQVNDRILVAGQTSAVANGIYIVTAVSWQLAPDWNNYTQAINGTLVPVSGGTVYSGTLWAASDVARTGSNLLLIGTDSITFSPAKIAAFSCTSSTSNTIAASGSKTFTVPANLAFAVGQNVIATATTGNSMTGTVASYSGTTLTITVASDTGSGTFSSWTIALQGLPGAAGATGAAGAVGATGASAFLNKFRNGNFNVAQRGTTGTVTTGNTLYTIDGWLIGATGATVSWAQIFNAGPSSNISLTGATSMTDTFIRQRIESTVAAPLAGQVCTVQIQMSNTTGASITPTLTVKHCTLQDNWGATVTDVNAVSLQPVDHTGLATILCYTFTAAANSYLGLEVTIDVGAALNTATSIYFQGADIRATPGVTLGLNASPPALEYLPIQTELAFCQRYFETTYDLGTAPGTSTTNGLTGGLTLNSTATSNVSPSFNYKVPKRAVPTTITYYDSAGTSGKITSFSSSAFQAAQSVGGSASIIASGMNGFIIFLDQSTFSSCYIHYTSSAEL